MANLHKKGFDQSTIDKLETVKLSFSRWLSVFQNDRYSEEIHVLDLFSGPGKDEDGEPGSPILFLESVLNNIDFNTCHKKFYFHFNDSKKSNIVSLKSEIQKIPVEKHFSDRIIISYSTEKFHDIFNDVSKIIQDYAKPCFLFMDQYGTGQIDISVINCLSKSKRCDFCFFISSSWVSRFKDDAKKLSHFENLDFDKLESAPPKEVHQIVCLCYESLAESICSELRFASFTIKKLSNYYGLIFGATNPYGIEKILEALWKKDPINGCANFDLYDTQKIQQEQKQPTLFQEFGLEEAPVTRLQVFEQSLKEFLLSANKTNKDVYDWTLSQCFLPTHSASAIKRFKKEGIINYEARGPLVNYDNCYKKQRIINYEQN